MADFSGFTDEEIADENRKRWRVGYDKEAAEREERQEQEDRKSLAVAYAAFGPHVDLNAADEDLLRVVVLRTISAAATLQSSHPGYDRFAILATAFWLWTEGLDDLAQEAHPHSIAGVRYEAFARAAIALTACDRATDMIDPESNVWMNGAGTLKTLMEKTEKEGD